MNIYIYIPLAGEEAGRASFSRESTELSGWMNDEGDDDDDVEGYGIKFSDGPHPHG